METFRNFRDYFLLLLTDDGQIAFAGKKTI